MMDELDARCERLLAVYREDDTPDDAAIARMLTRHLRRVDEQPASRPERAATQSIRRDRRAWWLLGIGVAAAAAAVVWSARATSTRLAGVDGGEQAPWQAEGEQSLGDARGAAPTPQRAAPPIPAELPHPTSSVALPAIARPASRPSPRPTAELGDTAELGVTAEPGPSIAEELERISAAEEFLRNGQPSAALRTVDQYLAEYSAGVMRHEAEALRTIARCDLGIAGAAEAAAEFIARNPRSASRRRIDRACAPTPVGVATGENPGATTIRDSVGH
jgi:hypothetical protein